MMYQNLEHEFLEIVEQHKKLIFKVSYLYRINCNDRKDLFQEIIVNLWKAYPDFKGNSKISTWIYRIAINTAVSWIRDSKKNSHITYYDCIPNIVDDTEYIEVHEKIQTVINHLNNIDKAIILLQLDGYAYEEISEITGLTKTNIATKISRIKIKLKKDLLNI